MSAMLGLFGWLPGQRAAAQERAHARRKALAGLEFALAELGHELERLAELSHATNEEDAAAATEAGIAARISEALQRGALFAADLSDDEAVSAWQRLAASTTAADLLGRGPDRAARLKVAAAECEQLQQFVDQELAGIY